MSEQDEEVDLKDLVLGKLENTAFLRNIRAQLRAQIYHLIESSNDEVKEGKNVALNNTLQKENGRLALALVDDLLDKLELKYTGTVFQSESSHKSKKTSLEIKHCLNLSLDDMENIDNRTPILVQLLDKINPIGDKLISEDKSTTSEQDDSQISRNSL